MDRKSTAPAVPKWFMNECTEWLQDGLHGANQAAAMLAWMRLPGPERIARLVEFRQHEMELRMTNRHDAGLVVHEEMNL